MIDRSLALADHVLFVRPLVLAEFELLDLLRDRRRRIVDELDEEE